MPMVSSCKVQSANWCVLSKMSLISDGELRRQLRGYGVDVGPINDTTRNLYQKKLRSLSGKNQAPSGRSAGAGVKRRRAPMNTSKQESATKRRPRVDNPPQPNHVHAKAKKGASLYPDLSEWLRISPGATEHAAAHPFSPTPHHSRPIPSGSRAIPGATHLPPHWESSNPIPSGSQVIPGVANHLQPTSRPPAPEPPDRESSNPVIPGLTKHLQPTSRPRAPAPHPLHRESSNQIRSGFQVIPSEQVPTSRSLHSPQVTHGATKHVTPSPSYSPSSCSPSEASSSPLSSSVGSISQPDPPTKKPHPRSSPGLGFLGTVTKFIGSQVNQFLNIAEPRRSLQHAAHSPDRSDSGEAVRHSPPSPEPINLTPLEEESPVEDELDFEDEITEATSLSTADASPESKEYDWELHPSEVTLCRSPGGALCSLGKGGFGEVFKGLRDGEDEVAVKIIRISSCTPAVLMQFKAEIDLISKLRHRHIVQFYGACIQPHNLYMVTELMSNDLFSVLRLPREAERYKWTGIYGREVLIGVASGLNYLHSRSPPVVHRDIKSPNVLVMDGTAKIADVGVARTMGATPDMTAQRGFSIAWAAPEVVYRRRATEKIDIWSLAVIMWEVVSGKLPRPGTLVLPAACPQPLRVLYSRCISDDPMGRPSALEVVTKLRNMQE